ncbi:hypothetical protein BRARA_J00942 [Brassica rapa]|uniref:Uncharacterized protein n=2 Tax=Brassica campestris TaxID=3711 RepID=A0A397XJE4_BRACM|nr:hypothetical protein BRARA_J00942 [Brassica rapa]
MESSMNKAFMTSKHETATFSSDQTPEESSWTMYFEDIFESSSSIVDVGEFSSSSVSDAMSFVATKKTLHVYSMMTSLDDNTRHGGGVVGENTNNVVKGESAVHNQVGLSVDLKQKGLCLVPMSMVTKFLG